MSEHIKDVAIPDVQLLDTSSDASDSEMDVDDEFSALLQESEDAFSAGFLGRILAPTDQADEAVSDVFSQILNNLVADCAHDKDGRSGSPSYSTEVGPSSLSKPKRSEPHPGEGTGNVNDKPIKRRLLTTAERLRAKRFPARRARAFIASICKRLQEHIAAMRASLRPAPHTIEIIRTKSIELARHLNKAAKETSDPVTRAAQSKGKRLMKHLTDLLGQPPEPPSNNIYITGLPNLRIKVAPLKMIH